MLSLGHDLGIFVFKLYFVSINHEKMKLRTRIKGLNQLSKQQLVNKLFEFLHIRVRVLGLN